MSNDASKVQGASGSRIGTVLHATCAMFIGIGVGVFYIEKNSIKCKCARSATRQKEKYESMAVGKALMKAFGFWMNNIEL